MNDSGIFGGTVSGRRHVCAELISPIELLMGRKELISLTIAADCGWVASAKYATIL
jgi:hypothetical protein